MLTPIRRSEALQAALGQTFGAAECGMNAIRILVAVLQMAECYALTTGDLRSTVELVGGLVGHPI